MAQLSTSVPKDNDFPPSPISPLLRRIGVHQFHRHAVSQPCHFLQLIKMHDGLTERGRCLLSHLLPPSLLSPL
ncbi:hypothetical protein BDZ89DRAFT_1061322, partial [Hymenopellis radicata]